MRQLMALAAARGLDVEFSRQMGGHLRGVYEHHKRLITINSSLTLVQMRCALCHELGHAWEDYCWQGEPHGDREAERRADEYAAGLLIDPVKYERAEREHGSHPGAIGIDLDVTPEIVLAWQRMANTTGLLRRLGERGLAAAERQAPWGCIA